MEAKIEKEVIVRRYCGVVKTESNSINITLEYTFLPGIDQPNSLIVHYDGELTESLVRQLVTLYEYTGEYAVFHVFKTDKCYLSDVTLYFNKLRKEVSHE